MTGKYAPRQAKVIRSHSPQSGFRGECAGVAGQGREGVVRLMPSILDNGIKGEL